MVGGYPPIARVNDASCDRLQGAEGAKPTSRPLGSATVENHFQVQVRVTDDATVFAVSGELDLTSSGELEDAIAELDGSETGLVILDLSGVDFMDSAGLAVVVKAHQRAEDAGRPFGLVNDSSQVRRLLSLTGMDKRMTIAGTREELLGAP
jgi:anti-sigma B factor antagonist